MYHLSIPWIFLFFWAFQPTNAQTKENQPNLLVCLSEDHAAHLFNSLDKLGSSINPTPHLSGIAKLGYLHPNAYCTSAVTENTAFSLLTGLVKNSNLETFDHSKFIGHSFDALGYKTAFIGTWTWEDKPKFYGFDYWHILEDPDVLFNPKVKHNWGNSVIEGHSTDIITDLAIRWIRQEGNSEKPFFMIVSYPSTRRPWIPPVRMIKNYNEEWFEAPDNFFTDFAQRAPANKYQRMNIAQDLDLIDDLFFQSLPDINKSTDGSSILEKNLNSMNDEQKSAWVLSWKAQNEAFARESPNEQSLAIWKFQRFIKNYLRCLLAMDENIGRLVESINLESDRGLNFVYTSERGRFTGEFGWFGSEWMYEPSARVPLVLASFNGAQFPKLNQDELFLDIDMYNLLKELGTTEAIALNKQNPDSNYSALTSKELYFVKDSDRDNYRVCSHHGLRKGKYKIIHYFPFDEWEFYDLSRDPGEEENLYRQNIHQDLIEKYKELLNQSAKLAKSQVYKVVFSEAWKRKQRSPEQRSR